MKKYSYDEALNASLEYFDGDLLAAQKFVDKYALRDKKQTNWLESNGYSVLHLTEHNINNNFNYCEQVIKNEL